MGGLADVHPFKEIKRLLPRYLFGRVLLILSAPLLLATMITTTIFVDQHWDNITRRLAEDIAGEIAATVHLAQNHSLSPKKLHTFARQNFGFDATLLSGKILRHPHHTPMRKVGAAFLEDALTRYLTHPYDLMLTNDTIFVSIEIGANILQIAMPRKRLLNKSTPVFMLWLLGTPLLLFLIAAVFLHKQVRPIKRLSEAMDRFGKGDTIPNFRPSGALEIRKVAIAFNRMRERIGRQIQQRTEMLAGVSHDLRTPLTRMSLQLALSENLPGNKELQSDIKEMGKMIDSYLAFAKGETGEKIQHVAVKQFLDEIVIPTTAEIEIHCSPELTARLKRQSMKRCMTNLLENAQRFATHIGIRALKSPQWLTILIDDNGPGIPANERQKVFKPFYRMDPSRNLDASGVGLGLSIAKDIAHQHGGQITLHDSPQGGLQVKIRIPA